MPNPVRRPTTALQGRRRAGFTLLEILTAVTVLGFAVAMTLGVFALGIKRVDHAERALTGTAELRYATDVISQAVRSSPILPTVSPDGLQLIVAPKDLGSAIVQDTTWLDSAQTVSGSKSNQRMLHLSNVNVPAVTQSIWQSTARPAAALAASDVATYFVGNSSLPEINLNDLFAVGDTITIPATSFGPSTTGVISSISNNSGNKTLTLTANLGVDVPNGTKITPTSGRRMLFQVTAAGELRYYPDNRDLTHFSVLAEAIDPAPLSNPADASSAHTVPFAIAATATDYVVLNLQQIPAGTSAGRTLQGVRSTVFTRTDPTIP